MNYVPDKANGIFLNVLVLFAVLWTLCVLQADLGTCARVFNQFRTSRFAVTVGRVLQSQLVAQTRSKGSRTYAVYDLKFKYTYDVGGKQFVSNRYRYGGAPSSHSDWSETLTRQFPAGTNIPVFYNPENPSESVISTGIRGIDIVSFWVPGAFTAVTLLVWRKLLLQKKVRAQPLSILRISDMSPGRRTTVRLMQYDPSVLALAPFIVLCFVADIATNTFAGSDPSMRLVLLISTAIIFLTTAIFLQRWLRLKRGDENLVIDDTAGTLPLPKTFGRKRLLTFPISTLKSVELREFPGKCYRCEPTLQFSEGPTAKAILAAWPNKFQGEIFIDWLCTRLQIANRKDESPNLRSS